MADTSKRRMSTVRKMSTISAAPIKIHVDVEAFEDSVFPPYLLDAATHRAYVDEIQSRELDMMMSKTKLSKDPPVEPKWKVQDVDYNAWRSNIVDKRTIYNFPEELIQDEEGWPVKGRPPSAVAGTELLEDDFHTWRERSFVAETRARIKSAKNSEFSRFVAQTMGEVNKPKPGPEFNFFCPSYKEDKVEKVLFKSKKKEQIPVDTIPRPRNLDSLRFDGQLFPRNFANIKLCNRSLTDTKRHYCDVLGPVACFRCIENLNKKIANEVQQKDFPRMDCKVTTLIAPRLARVMTSDLHESVAPKPLTKSEPNMLSVKNKFQSQYASGTLPKSILKFPSVEKKELKRANSMPVTKKTKFSRNLTMRLFSRKMLPAEI